MNGSARNPRSEFESSLRGTILTQDQFAERLCISKRAFLKYLYGELYPPCDVIAKAVEEFDVHSMVLYHLTNQCPIARVYVKKLKELMK
nr:MAG TPA: SOS-response transcriptional repressor [Bacteriophage sp.]